MEFPKLKTGAWQQYGGGRGVRYGTRVLRFLDGDEQRFRVQAKGERRWMLRLTQLDEGELAAVEQFFMAMQGVVQEFAFVDPETGARFERCRFGSEDVWLRLAGIHEGEAVVEIVEVME